MSSKENPDFKNDEVCSQKENEFYSNKRSKSVFKRLKNAYNHSSTLAQFFVTVITILLHTVLFLVIVVLLMSIPVAMIVIGALKFHQCQAERFIPIWMIVAGCVFFVTQLAFILKTSGNMKKENLPEERGCNPIYSGLSFLFGLFSFAWFIAGNVWVFSSFQPNIADSSRTDYCDVVLYYFAFVLIIIAYLWMIITCCCSGCIAVVGFFKPKKKESEPAKVDP